MASRALRWVRVWVFDLDDTLMRTVEVYIRQIEKAYYFLCRQLRDQSPTLHQFKEKQLEIDSRLRHEINPVTKEPYYYSMKRFPLSLVRTYVYFCKQANLEPSYEVQKKFEEIGNAVYLSVGRYKKMIKKEAYQLLPFLKSQGDILILLTKGDRRVQRKKLKAFKAAGLLKYFSKCIIVVDKTPTIFRKIKRQLTGKKNHKRFYSVGNEYPSDIETAIKAGYFGVWIPVTSAAVWEKGKLGKIEENRDKRNSNRYDSLGEIKAKYDYL